MEKKLKQTMQQSSLSKVNTLCKLMQSLLFGKNGPDFKMVSFRIIIQSCCFLNFIFQETILVSNKAVVASYCLISSVFIKKGMKLKV